jgi:hypothetical protein
MRSEFSAILKAICLYWTNWKKGCIDGRWKKGGLFDDIGIMAAALVVVGLHVKPIHKKTADEKIGLWFN